MTRLGADVHELDLLAKSFDAAATRLDGNASVIDGQLRSLWWRGSIADRFTASWASVDRRHLSEIAGTLRGVAAEVRFNACQQQAASGSSRAFLPQPEGVLIPLSQGTVGGSDGSSWALEASDSYGSTGTSSFTGVTYGHVDRDAWNNLVGDDGMRVGIKEGGLRVGFDEDGEFVAMAGYEATIVNANRDGVIIGNDDMGLTGGLEAEFLSASAEAGYQDGSVGAEVGVNFASAEGELGANVGGVNVSAHGEIGLKAELGISIGKNTEIKLPFVTIGFSIGF